MQRLLRAATLASLAAMALAGPALAATIPGWSRLTLFGTSQTTQFDDGVEREFNELTAALTWRSPIDEERAAFEYALDLRASTYPSTGRASRTRISDAWAGGRTAGGRLALRAGQMWLHELGGIGSVGGAMAEFRKPLGTPGRQLRAGVFAGVEPKLFEAGFTPDVRKGGAWVALDANRRRHVLGYAIIRTAGLTERSVLTSTNYLPVGKTFFAYQAAEYDLSGPGGEGKGGLRYFFLNGRYTPASRVELMANVHRGRSIDTRQITQDLIDGKPIDQKALTGFLFESIGGRVTVEVIRNVRVHAGYARDKNNRDDQTAGRISAGVWAANVAGSGIDFTVSDQRVDRGGASYDAWYASLGRNFGSRLYLTADYATSLSYVRILGVDGAVIEHRPRTRRYGLHGLWNATRVVALIVTVEEIRDDTSKDQRVLLGTTYRF